MLKLIVLDVETSGKIPTLCGLLEIGGFVVIDGEIVEEFEFSMRPFTSDMIEEKALQVNGIKRETLWGRPSPISAFVQFEKLLDKYIDRYDPDDKFSIVGFNSNKFDCEVIRRWFEKNNNLNYNSYFHVGSIDMFALMSYSLKKHRHLLPNMRLTSICEFLKIPVDMDQAHGSLYDCKLTYELYKLYEKGK